MKPRMQSRRQLALAALVLLLCVKCIAQSPVSSLPAKADASAQASTAKPVVLDRVVAIINGDVLLESDVREEMRLGVLQPISVPPGQNTLVRAARRLITRSLILQQMKDQKQQINYSVTDDDVRKSLAELRTEIPPCKKANCTSAEGWQSFLKANGLTEQEVTDHWRQRLEILKFIDMRFGSSIRISRQDIQKYYHATVVPNFEKQKQATPSLTNVSPRIREILLQQQVNSMLRDWLQSLRAQGTVQILDPVYGEISSSSDDEGGGN